MNGEYYYLKRAVDVLRRAFKLVVLLKVTRHNNPSDVVILNELESCLDELYSIGIDSKINSSDGNTYNLLGQLFLKLVGSIIKLFNIPQSCKQYLRIQILYI